MLQSLPANTAEENAWVNQLSVLINELILHDFNALLQLLYRVDVSEREVKSLLQQQPHQDAGMLLARMLLQRQKEKAALRRQFNQDSSGIPDEDRW